MSDMTKRREKPEEERFKTLFHQQMDGDGTRDTLLLIQFIRTSPIEESSTGKRSKEKKS
jgi:hypothetical protein